MKERELGTMQIAGKKTVIVETQITEDSPHGRRSLFRFNPLAPLMNEMAGSLISTEWYARSEEGKDVAWGVLIESLKEKDGVVFYASVALDYRRIGLGRFMIRLGTDQAIHYRKRSILVEVESTNEIALKILDEEEFEKQPEQHPGYTLLRKELKWI